MNFLFKGAPAEGEGVGLDGKGEGATDNEMVGWHH